MVQNNNNIIKTWDEIFEKHFLLKNSIDDVFLNFFNENNFNLNNLIIFLKKDDFFCQKKSYLKYLEFYKIALILIFFNKSNFDKILTNLDLIFFYKKNFPTSNKLKDIFLINELIQNINNFNCKNEKKFKKDFEKIIIDNYNYNLDFLNNNVKFKNNFKKIKFEKNLFTAFYNIITEKKNFIDTE